MQLSFLQSTVRSTVRGIARSPAWPALVIASMTIMIGVIALLFAMVDAIFLNRIAISEPERVLVARNQLRSGGTTGISLPDIQDWLETSTLFDAAGWYRDSGPLIIDRGLPTSAGRLSASALDTLAVRPVIGRRFMAGDSGVVLLSHSLWQSHFEGAPDVVGRTLSLQDTPYEVIGVMPPSFHFPDYQAQLWVHLEASGSDLRDRDNSLFKMVVRLRPHASLSAARAELAKLNARLDASYPRPAPRSVYIDSLPAVLFPNGRLVHASVWTAIALLMILGTANLTILLTSRALRRLGALRTRVALGATRAHLFLHTLLEISLLSVPALILAVCLDSVLTDSVVNMMRGWVPRIEALSIDATVVVFGFVVALAIASVTSLFATSRASDERFMRSALATSSAISGSGIRMTYGGLFLVEVAITFVLLVAAGSSSERAFELNDVDLGVERDDTLIATVRYPFALMQGTDALTERTRFSEAALRRIRALPDVAAAAIGVTAPFADVMSDFVWEEEVFVGDTAIPAAFVLVGSDYFRAMGARPLHGREIGISDQYAAAPVAVLSESAATALFGSVSAAVGQNVYIPVGDSLPLPLMPPGSLARYRGFQDRGGWAEFGLSHPESGSIAPGQYAVVGVVSNIRHSPEELLGASGARRIYVDYMWHAVRESSGVAETVLTPLAFLVRARPGAPVAASVRDILLEENSQITLGQVERLGDAVARATGGVTAMILSFVTTILSLVALVIACTGIYGIASEATSVQRRSVAIRMALGAGRGKLVWLLLRPLLSVATAGVLAGCLLSVAVARLLRSMAEATPGVDLPLLSSVALVVVVIVIAAAGVPVWRTVNLKLANSLRAE